jgi:hypothetical protein
MKRPKNTASLAKQQAYWYGRLKEEGFKDIEDPRTRTLKSWSSQIDFEAMPKKARSGEKPYGPYTSLAWKQSQEMYYRMAGFFMNEHKFEGSLDKKIWYKHTEGRTQRSIGDELGLTVKQVKYVLDRLKAIMFKEYL